MVIAAESVNGNLEERLFFQLTPAFKLGSINNAKRALAMTGLPVSIDSVRAEAQNYMGYDNPRLESWG